MFNPRSPCESFQTVMTGVLGWYSLLRETSDGLWVAIGYRPTLEVASTLLSYTDHQRLSMWAKQLRSCWESAQDLRETRLEECGSICKEVQSLELAAKTPGVHGQMGQCYWLFVVQETKIKVWSMYSPTSEGELTSMTMKYAFTINNSDE